MFMDRQDAGKQVARALSHYKEAPNVIVIGLPRGGVVLAYEVAVFLHQPLDVICPRKVGAPFNLELAVGAITETGEGYFNEDVIQTYGVTKAYLDAECAKEKAVAQRRLSLFRKGLKPIDFRGKTVIIVDDGLATGATMKAAIQSIKAQNAGKIVVAVPVSPPDTAREIKEMCDEFICLDTPWSFQAVGQFYRTFGQTEDYEVVELLDKMQKKDKGHS